MQKTNILVLKLKYSNILGDIILLDEFKNKRKIIQ